MSEIKKARRPEKIAIMREAIQTFEGQSFAYLMNFAGVTVDKLSALRADVATAGAKMVVVKNTIIAKVAQELGWEDFSEFLVGPTAVILGTGDAAAVAKVVVEFTKKNDKASVKGGQVDSKVLTAEVVTQLSELPTKDVMRAILLGTLVAPLTSVLYLLKAKMDKEGGAPEETTEEAPVADEATPATEDATSVAESLVTEAPAAE